MIVSPQDIVEASRRLESRVHRTPLIRSRLLDEQLGCRVFLKAENLQRAGSFKIRGAFNTIAQLDEHERRRGVISYSSGNHAQGVALASQMLGVPATIVVPEDIVEAKRQAAERYGARLIAAGVTSADRMERATAVCAEEGLTMIPPYDDPRIIAGQGTVGREMLEEIADLDAILAPIGGGGLMAGIATAARGSGRPLRLIGVEPQDADDTAQSMRAGRRVRIPQPATIADGLRAVEPGELTFPILQRTLDEVVTVSEDAILETLCLVIERTKMLVEPSGAVALAALASGVVSLPGQCVGVVLSGGNVSLPSLARLLSRADPPAA